MKRVVGLRTRYRLECRCRGRPRVRQRGGALGVRGPAAGVGPLTGQGVALVAPGPAIGTRPVHLGPLCRTLVVARPKGARRNDRGLPDRSVSVDSQRQVLEREGMPDQQAKSAGANPVAQRRDLDPSNDQPARVGSIMDFMSAWNTNTWCGSIRPIPGGRVARTPDVTRPCCLPHTAVRVAVPPADVVHFVGLASDRHVLVTGQLRGRHRAGSTARWRRAAGSLRRVRRSPHRRGRR